MMGPVSELIYPTEATQSGRFCDKIAQGRGVAERYLMTPPATVQSKELSLTEAIVRWYVL